MYKATKQLSDLLNRKLTNSTPCLYSHNRIKIKPSFWECKKKRKTKPPHLVWDCNVGRSQPKKESDKRKFEDKLSREKSLLLRNNFVIYISLVGDLKIQVRFRKMQNWKQIHYQPKTSQNWLSMNRASISSIFWAVIAPNRPLHNKKTAILQSKT